MGSVSQAHSGFCSACLQPPVNLNYEELFKLPSAVSLSGTSHYVSWLVCPSSGACSILCSSLRLTETLTVPFICPRDCHFDPHSKSSESPLAVTVNLQVSRPPAVLNFWRDTPEEGRGQLLAKESHTYCVLTQSAVFSCINNLNFVCLWLISRALKWLFLTRLASFTITVRKRSCGPPQSVMVEVRSPLGIFYMFCQVILICRQAWDPLHLRFFKL